MDFGNIFNTQSQAPIIVPEPQKQVPVAVPIKPAPEIVEKAQQTPLVLPDSADLPMDNAGNPELIKDPLNACITFMLNQLLENGTVGSSVVVPYSGMRWYSPRTNTVVTFEAFRNRVRAIVGAKRPYIRQSLIRYASGGCNEVRQGMELTLMDKGV